MSSAWAFRHCPRPSTRAFLAEKALLSMRGNCSAGAAINPSGSLFAWTAALAEAAKSRLEFPLGMRFEWAAFRLVAPAQCRIRRCEQLRASNHGPQNLLAGRSETRLRSVYRAAKRGVVETTDLPDGAEVAVASTARVQRTLQPT